MAAKYPEIKKYILEQIDNGKFKEDVMLPSEKEFTELFNVSRMTVRRAFDDLIQDGVLIRKRGSGLFLAKKKMSRSMNQISVSKDEQLHKIFKQLTVKVLKATEFLINYLQAYKDLGIDGVFMAEPLAGILSPNLCDEFSSRYVKEIVSALDDDSFLVAYHNCGNNTLKMVDTILSTGCRLYHFGNAVSIEQMLKLMPKDVMVMGNIDPVSLKDASKEDVIAATNALLEAIGDVDNFVISSGCDIPPFARWENIDAFMKTAQEYYQK
ncbi:uroporphyrinogen decarboxylase family protein [uncultured Thomasclavelia sp.]|uniref:uroporphyrinogen decarboxylase family protein n=1 Tax=uncultured Thomasclavelia sp. TaxID=3025759 RepID=UPI00260F2EA7|nr:uroporphyrinogen decarboxylase family protein [uncultured Thomasclavelia sp.]